MEDLDLTKLSERTKAEMAAGKEMAALNAALMAAAEKSRAAEGQPVEVDEAQKAVEEAKPLKKSNPRS